MFILFPCYIPVKMPDIVYILISFYLNKMQPKGNLLVHITQLSRILYLGSGDEAGSCPLSHHCLLFPFSGMLSLHWPRIAASILRTTHYKFLEVVG